MHRREPVQGSGVVWENLGVVEDQLGRCILDEPQRSSGMTSAAHTTLDHIEVRKYERKNITDERRVK